MTELAVETLGEVASATLSADNTPGRDAIDIYNSHGVVCLRGAFGQDWLQIIESGIDESMRTAALDGGHSDKIKKEGDEGFFFYDEMMWRRIEPFRRFAFESHVADMVKALLETEALLLYYDFLLIKTPGCFSGNTPWHQDHSYYPLNGRKIVNCWVALDPIPRETSLRFVRHSHLPDELYRQISFNPDREYENLGEQQPIVPDIDDNPDQFDVITCDLAPGDTLIWNSRMFHSAPGNHLGTRRGALSTSWLGDDVTYHDVPQETDPPDRGENLKEGDWMECDTFPRVR